MNTTNQGFEIQSTIDSIRRVIRSVGESVSETVSPAELWTERGLRKAALAALVAGPKTGHEIMEHIHAASEWGIKPPASRVYPLLESFLDEGLVTVTVKKNRKVYTISEAGAEAAASADRETTDSNPKGSSGWSLPTWPGPDNKLTTASSRLAQAAFELARHGTKEQQDAAAEAIDQARRTIHSMLAAQ
jgi:DNA-binding PadR family transcriptional regulator